MLSRYTLLIALLLPGLVAAQPVPPAPPRPPAPQSSSPQPSSPQSSSPQSSPPRPKSARPAPKAPGKRDNAPVVRSKPPPKRPAVRPAATAPAPAPIPDPVPEKPPEPTKGSVTGMPLPRFAALRADEVYMRLGPGKRYPIEWVYKRRDLPMQIEREFEEWRLVRDQENTKGWVHQATLAPRRTGIVLGEHVLRREARDDAAPVARLKPGVIVRLRSCDATTDWCQTQIQDYRGWMKRTEVWGTLPGEGFQ